MGCGSSSEAEAASISRSGTFSAKLKDPTANVANYATDEDVKELFKLWDFDSSGKLDAGEISVMLGKVDAENVIKQMDNQNVDGELDESEFIQYLRTCCPFVFTDASGEIFGELRILIQRSRDAYFKKKKEAQEAS